ncbi:ethanolamine utilization protein EutQ [Clostridioides difficile]|uniref:ethanolamine utilization protein EutQ n=1 Tax=Clostridioides difficile TaxID=1496 RepID=UPI000D1E9704|nr:ethanolamine utilization protein EutQ [Clostridioides difficile]MDL5066817.1 ethanolamine utilization protein EutQ [Clostridioides difficile]MDN9452989.1 ethanolamine utilization protein EutQ [Clostridioides difficile]HBF7897738.1 ethanolamine utilization protein EutQ [Clostridioides difficile]
MDISNIDKNLIETLVRQIIEEKISETKDRVDFVRNKDISGITSIKLPTVKVSESDRLDTGNPSDVVYTKDLFTLEESPRLGCGMMEMKETTFDWTLNYDEIDYVIDGTLDIIIDERKVSASSGELIFIPKGSKIQFSVPDYARFIYVTYPADWASQN